MERINIAEKFARFSEQGQPKIVAELNGQEVKLVKVPWHHHDDVEEMFLVRRGRFRVEFRDRLWSWGQASLSPCLAVSSIALVPTKQPR